MTQQLGWQRAERPDEDLMFTDQRVLLEDAFSKAFSETPELRDLLRARGQLGYLRETAVAYGEAMVGMVEQLLVRDGWTDYIRENGFWAGWSGFCAEHGQASNWLPSGHLVLEPVAMAANKRGSSLAGVNADQLVAVITAAIKAATSEPTVTESVIEVTGDDGKVKTTRLTTARRVLDVTP
jgi:hypothetical protein